MFQYWSPVNLISDQLFSTSITLFYVYITGIDRIHYYTLQKIRLKDNNFKLHVHFILSVFNTSMMVYQDQSKP